MKLSERRSARTLLPALLATAILSAGGAAALLHHTPVQAQGAVVRGLPDFTELVDMVGPSVVNIRTLERRAGRGERSDRDGERRERRWSSGDEERGGRGDRQAATELRSPRPTARPRSQDPFFDKPYEPDPSAEPSWEQKDAQASTASSGATTQSPGSALSRFIKPKRKVAALLGGSGTTRR